jgi:hypothetical protein
MMICKEDPKNERSLTDRTDPEGRMVSGEANPQPPNKTQTKEASYTADPGGANSQSADEMRKKVLTSEVSPKNETNSTDRRSSQPQNDM